MHTHTCVATRRPSQATPFTGKFRHPNTTPLSLSLSSLSLTALCLASIVCGLICICAALWPCALYPSPLSHSHQHTSSSLTTPHSLHAPHLCSLLLPLSLSTMKIQEQDQTGGDKTWSLVEGQGTMLCLPHLGGELGGWTVYGEGNAMLLPLTRNITSHHLMPRHARCC